MALDADQVRSAVGVYFVCVKRDEYRTRKFPAGSIVLDPWGIVRDQEGVTVVRIGRR